MAELNLDYYFTYRGVNEAVSMTCPSCKGVYNHIVGVRSVVKAGTNLTIKNRGIYFTDEITEDSIAIRFWCEQGCDDFIVSFIEHKGITYIDCSPIKGAGCSGHAE